MTAVLAVACGLFGLIVGAFLNVLIDRVPEKKRLRAGCRNRDDAVITGQGVVVMPWVIQGRRCRLASSPSRTATPWSS